MGVFLPAHLVVHLASGEVLANLPDRALPDGERALLWGELLRPVAGPLALAIFSGLLAFFGWSVLWHGGMVRWCLGGGAARVRLAEILGHGAVWWWRYARLALAELAVMAVLLAVVWVPLLVVMNLAWMTASAGRSGIALLFGLALSLIVVVVCRMAAFRAAWLLGEPGRRSVVVAWIHGLIAGLRSPLGSLFPLVVWVVPGFGLLVMPLVVEGPLAATVMLLSWLGTAFCAVALYLSYAPPEAAADLRRRSVQRR
jgi:hypothetical protein